MTDLRITRFHLRQAVMKLQQAEKEIRSLTAKLSDIVVKMDARSALTEPDCPALLLAWQGTVAALNDAFLILNAAQQVVNILTEVSNMAGNDYISNCDDGV